MHRKQTISAIIPAYNAADFVCTAIDSVLCQTYPALEILVVDDGSKDDLGPALRHYPSSVRLIRKTNGGPASARNLGSREATGDWLAFLDADDSWLREKLERQIRLATPELGMIHCLYRRPGSWPVPDLVRFEDLWIKNCIACSTVMIRRDLFLSLGGFDEDPQLIGVEDYNLWLRVAASRWGIATLQHLLINYTRAPGSLTQQVERFANAELKNSQKIAEQFRIGSTQLKQKELQILDDYGRELLHYRHLLWPPDDFSVEPFKAVSPFTALRGGASPTYHDPYFIFITF